MREVEEHFAYMARRRRQRIVAMVAACAAIAGGSLWASRASHEQWLKNASLDMLQQSFARNPDDDGLAYMLCFRLLDDDQAGKALPIARRLVQRDPGSAGDWFILGRASAACGRAVEAVAAYRKVAELDPKLEAAHSLPALIYGNAGLATETLAEMDAAAKIGTKPPIDSALWARCLMAKGRHADAWRVVSAAIAQNPTTDGVYPLLPELGAKLHKETDAELWLRQRIALTMLYPMGRVRIALCRLLLARPHDRKTLEELEYQAQTAVQDRAPANFAVLSQVLALRGDLQGARSAAETGLQLEPNHVECLQRLAEACERQGDAGRARAIRERIARLTAEDRRLAALRKAAMAAPADPAARLSLASALDGAGRYAEAAEECHEVLRLAPGDRTAQSLLDSSRVKALEKLGAQSAAASTGATSTGAAPSG